MDGAQLVYVVKVETVTYAVKRAAECVAAKVVNILRRNGDGPFGSRLPRKRV